MSKPRNLDFTSRGEWDTLREEWARFQKAVHKLAKEKGFYEEPRRPLESLMLIVSEVAEAAEELRVGSKPIYRVGPKYEGTAVELADTVIRIMDLAEYEGWGVVDAMVLKHEFNKTRPYKHGKKV